MMSRQHIAAPHSRVTLVEKMENVKSSEAIRKIFTAPTARVSLSAHRSSGTVFSGKRLKNAQIEVLKQELTEYCLTHMQDSYRVHLNRLKGLQILDTLVSMATIGKIGSEFAIHMVWAALSCIHHFLLRLRADNGFMQWFRRKQAKKSIKTFDRLLGFLTPLYYSIVFNAVITFLEEACIWEVEYFCSNLLHRVLRNAEERHRYESINEIISLIENSTLANPLTSRYILQALFDILDAEHWSWMNDDLLIKFLDMHYRSLTPENDHSYNYEPLEKGLETSIRAMGPHFDGRQLFLMVHWMVDVVSNERISDNNLLTYGSLLERIAIWYTERAAKLPLSDQILPPVLKTIISPNLMYSLLGHRILHNLVDRCKNKVKFDTPRIFLRNFDYHLKVKRFAQSDKVFFQHYREILHKTEVDALLKHGSHKVYLETIYISIALFLVEIPCAYTAAAGVCLAMALQDAALDSKNIQITHAHRIHAIVVSLMSLICYIHKADVFYDYVETIVDRRANFAPHLNPPLKMKYTYAQHHVLWNKPDLFFEDWETRYGLWRCFKNQKNIVVMHT